MWCDRISVSSNWENESRLNMQRKYLETFLEIVSSISKTFSKILKILSLILKIFRNLSILLFLNFSFSKFFSLKRNRKEKNLESTRRYTSKLSAPIQILSQHLLQPKKIQHLLEKIKRINTASHQPSNNQILQRYASKRRSASRVRSDSYQFVQFAAV